MLCTKALTIYPQELPTFVDTLMVALDAANWDVVRKTAAALRKTAGTLHNEKLEQFARDLEATCDSQSLSVCALAIVLFCVG